MTYLPTNPTKYGAAVLNSTEYVLVYDPVSNVGTKVALRDFASFIVSPAAKLHPYGHAPNPVPTATTLTALQSGTKSTHAITAAPFQVASVWNGTNNVLTADGTAGTVVAATSALAATGTLWLGDHDNSTSAAESWNGSSAEHIVMVGGLTATDQATIRSSQKSYYGTP